MFPAVKAMMGSEDFIEGPKGLCREAQAEMDGALNNVQTVTVPARFAPPPPSWGRVGVGVSRSSDCSALRPQLSQLQKDGFQNAIEIFVKFLVAEAQNNIPRLYERSVARGIAREFEIGRMRRSIDFEYKPRLEAHEVNNEAKKRNLPAEAKTRYLPRVEGAPEYPLGMCRVLPQSARRTDCRAVYRITLDDYTPTLTLPHEGGGNDRASTASVAVERSSRSDRSPELLRKR